MFEEEFAERLAQLRIAKGVSARDMSLSVGQNAGYINSIENGKALPSMSSFLFICDYLGISPKDFFDLDVELPKEVCEIVNNLKRLKKEQLVHIGALIKDLIEK